MLLAKKGSDEQVLLAEDQAWMKSSSDSNQEININMVFMAKMEKVLSDSDKSSSSTEETIAEVAYYTSESESESEYEYETSEYYNNSTNYCLFVNDNDDQEIFHDTIEYASENFIENHIDSQKDYDKSEVDHNESEEKNHLVDKLIRKFNHKITKCQKCIEKANQQSKDLENQNKDLQEKYDVLINQVNTFEEQNNEFNEQMKVLSEKNADLLAQTEVLQDQLKQTRSLKPYVPTVILEKIIIDLEDEFVSLLEKEKANLETIESLKSKVFESSENIVQIYLWIIDSRCSKHMTEDGVDSLTGDRLLNLYTIALNEVASNSSACLIAKASSSQSWLWHQRLSHLNFLTINNLVKNNLVQGLPKMKFEKDHLCFACEQGKIHRKHHKSKTAFASN
nr:retrovirus-related Pol polyprotein from transposon TNT 1-94 [Tanacetum cinerariifolium]